MWLDGAREINGRLHAQIRHAVLHHLEVYGDNARHFDGTAERDFSISLREVQVSNGELGSLHMNWKVDLATTAQVLNVAVSSMLRTSWLQIRLNLI